MHWLVNAARRANLTETSPPVDQRRGRDLDRGMTFAIRKPYEPPSFAARVKAALRRAGSV